MRLILTGKPNCSYCVQLENAVKKITDLYDKVDISLPQNSELLEIVMKGGNRTPATLIFGDNRYIVSKETPAKVPQVHEWLNKVGYFD